jgi:hypothetical protein
LTFIVSSRSDARDPLLVPPAGQPEPLLVPEIDPPPPPLPLPTRDADPPTTSSESITWARLMRELSEEIVPGEYEVRRDWGETTRVFSGFNIRPDNGFPRVSKRTRRVNHGLWRRFRVQLVRPEHRLRFELRNVRMEETGGMAAQIVLTARLRCTADAVYWNYGVRGPNTTVLTDLTLQVKTDWRLVLEDNEPDAWIPEYHLVPEVQRVRLRIRDLDVRRIGLIGGDVADELGDASRGIVEELLEQQQPRVLRRLQRETGQLD